MHRVGWSMVALLAGATACDPCAGTPSCSVSPRVSYTGHLVEHASGKSVPGGTIVFIRTGGVALASDTIRTTTGGDGFFSIAATAETEGTVTGTLHVEPPGRKPYDVRGLSLETTTTSGDGGSFGRIVSDPYILYIGQLRNRLSGANIGAFAGVSFKRTGGIAATPGLIEMLADESGRFHLAPTVTEPGTLYGELAITAPASGFPLTIRIPLAIETRYQDQAYHDVTIVNLGSTLPWVGEVYRRGTNEHVAGIAVDFRQTGGPTVSPSQFTSTTNDIGLFPLQPTPSAEGEVTGDITIHPPGSLAPFTVKGVRIRTTADDTVRLAGRYGYGAQAFGLVELRYRTTMTPINSGASVVFRRTGGVRTLTETYNDIVKSSGFAGVLLPADTSGDVIGDLEVRLGEPYGTEIVHNVRVTSAFDDTQRFIGSVTVGRWFPQIAQVLDSATRKPIPGARVTFTRVDGVDFSPNPYTVTPNATDGIFALRPQPLADGDVVGNLTFILPAPYTNTTIAGIHLHTSMSDTLQFVGTWLIAPKK